MDKYLTREAWLTAGIDELRSLFGESGHAVPSNVRVTCGWPSKSALARKRQRIGECWGAENSDARVFEIFISPSLASFKQVIETLAHELVHATVGLKAKHGAAFKRVALAIGLEGKMTATHAGDKLVSALAGIAEHLGEYPHSELHGMTTGERKQGTRLLKAECAVCGYTVRITRKWLDLAGAPLCPVADCDDYSKPLSNGISR